MSDFIYRAYHVVLILSLLATVLSAVALFRIELNIDITGILPDDLPEVKEFMESKDVFGFDQTIVVLRARSGSILEYIDFAETFASNLFLSFTTKIIEPALNLLAILAHWI